MKKNCRYGLLIILLFAVSLFLYACGERPAALPDSAAPLNFEDIPDGTHRGIFTYGGFNYTVDVVAAGGQVTQIIVVANVDNEASREAEAVLDKVVENQSLQVDMTSGATVSSRALLKAVENAIKNAKQQ